MNIWEQQWLKDDLINKYDFNIMTFQFIVMIPQVRAKANIYKWFTWLISILLT